MIIDDGITNKLNMCGYELLDSDTKRVIVRHKISKNIRLQEIHELEIILNAEFMSVYTDWEKTERNFIIKNAFILKWNN